MSSYAIRTGTLREAADVMSLIPEFDRTTSTDAMSERIGRATFLPLVAEEDGELIGFKLAYLLENGALYSWLGGVIPSARGRGVAQALLEAQEAWAKAHGVRSLRVTSRNRFPAMLQMLRANGYAVESTDVRPNVLDTRVRFRKELLP